MERESLQWQMQPRNFSIHFHCICVHYLCNLFFLSGILCCDRNKKLCSNKSKTRDSAFVIIEIIGNGWKRDEKREIELGMIV